MDQRYINDLLFPNLPRAYSESTHGYLEIGSGRKIAAFGVRLAEAERVVVYCHGNGEDAYDAAKYLGSMLPQSVGLIIPEYAGYGLSDGVKCEEGCYAAAACAYDWVTQRHGYTSDRITFAGYSLGSGVAVWLASEKSASALVLFAPFYNGRRLLANWIGDEEQLGNQDPFPSDRIISRISTPTVVIHGASDEVIPISQGRSLFRAAGNPTVFHEVDAQHNDLLVKFGYDGFRSVFQ